MANAWGKIGLREHNGVNIPLFSLHSKNSCGIGEFTDLIPLISWCKEISFDVIQLLPLNDTGPERSPYSALSAFALNLIHLGLAHLPFVNQEPSLQALLPKMQALNKLERCDYTSVHLLKDEFLKTYYKIFGEKILQSEDFKQFKKENPWLPSYALFKTLRILHDWKRFEEFPLKIQNPTLLTYTELLSTYENEINFHIFVQYLCFTQFKEVKKIAGLHNVFLMGDIPILINRDSADVWMERHLFDLNYSAGAPPDMYAVDGQSWGFPTYNWKEIEKEDYQWWKLRLKVASNLYDIYRIDHIVGFFRIWSIPYGAPATHGHYIPENPDVAMTQGEKILKMMIESSPMLPIGEDLGNVPDAVRKCMSDLSIPGTKVMRWERLWNENKRFIELQNYPLLSLTTVSTHDSEPLALWWRDKKDEAMDYAKFKGFNYSETITKQQQMEILKDSLHTKSLFHINLLQEYLSLVEGFTSNYLDDERVNVPGTITDQNWTYKFRQPIEEIVKNQELKNIIRSLL